MSLPISSSGLAVIGDMLRFNKDIDDSFSASNVREYDSLNEKLSSMEQPDESLSPEIEFVSSSPSFCIAGAICSVPVGSMTSVISL